MTDRKSFWREPMVWLVFGLPLASIVAGVTLVVIAVRSGGADTVSDQVQRHLSRLLVQRDAATRWLQSD